MKKIIYIAGKYRGASTEDIRQNIQKSEGKAAEVWKKGAVAVCPHKNSAFMSGIIPEEDFINGYLELLLRCDALYLVENWRESSGARLEIEQALKHDIPVLIDSEQLDDYLGGKPYDKARVLSWLQ